MEKFVVRIESVSRVVVEAESAEQAKAMAEKGYEIDFNTELLEVWDSYDEMSVEE